MSFDCEWGSNRFQNQSNQADKQKTTIFDDSFLIRHVGRPPSLGYGWASLTRLLMAPGVGIEPTTNRLTVYCSAAELPRNVKNSKF